MKNIRHYCIAIFTAILSLTLAVSVWLVPSVTWFYTYKGLLAITGCILLVWHMSSSWNKIIRLGQRLRYITLLWFAMTIAYASTTQVRGHSPIQLSAVLMAIGCILLIVTMIVSIREAQADRDDRRLSYWA